MKKLNNCIVENCIPTPASCVDWNAGDIKTLGICNGDPLTKVIWEIVNKLEELAGEDISTFDIDTLIDICNAKAPAEVNLVSILNLLKNNQVCLKDYIDTLNDKLDELSQSSGVKVNLKCYADFDNLGNALSITREELDQLVINELCAHEEAIDTINGKITNLQEQIDDLNNDTTVEELSFATCVDAGVKPTSSQVKAVADAHCELEGATGDAADVSSALSNTPDWNEEFQLLPNWNLSPGNLAENYSNLLIAFGNLLDRVKFMEENCCAATCDDIKLGFSAVFNEDMDAIIISFTWGAGTVIPSGFEDLGSTGKITDINGNVVTFNLEIANNYEVEVPISGLSLHGDLAISITAKLGNEGLVCEKCLYKVVTSDGCGYCEITATGEEGSSAVLMYRTGEATIVATPVYPVTTTTTSSTTTTTTTV